MDWPSAVDAGTSKKGAQRNPRPAAPPALGPMSAGRGARGALGPTLDEGRHHADGGQTLAMMLLIRVGSFSHELGL